MAFQVADDLLDYTEAQEVTGKPTGLDLRERRDDAAAHCGVA